MIPVISIVGTSDCGKTTLIEKLIPEIISRGYKVGTIKHDVHSFEIDHPGKDSFRHTQAGANTVVISSPAKAAMVKAVESEMSLDEVINNYLLDVDIILTEGFKRENKFKIEVLRKEVSSAPVSRPEELVLIATDMDDLNLAGAAKFDLNDIKGMVNLIEEKFLKNREDVISLTVDGKDIPLNEFVRKFLTGAVLGMISSLHGVNNPKDIMIRIIKKYP
ncbi:MAG: molybdopterin-guanine dinucleotide biosynthesis protein B [Actinobacteria bacterium]|nr:molybdopterin-guanine dinucleotide biosynthesis protein B [Actinomycetota bacterium]